MAITRPTTETKVSLSQWGNPVTDELNAATAAIAALNSQKAGWVGGTPPAQGDFVGQRWIDSDNGSEYWWTGDEWAELGSAAIVYSDLIGRVPVSEFGVKGNGANEAVALQAAFNSGEALIIPKGMKVTVGAQLIIPSGLDLVIDGRIERNWGAGYAGTATAMFRTGTGATPPPATNVRITGNGSVGAVSLTVGGGAIFNGVYHDTVFANFTVDTYWGGQAFIFGGNRIRMDRIRVINSAVAAGTGAIRFTEGDDFVAYGCHVECGDDCLQFVPGVYEQRPPIRRGAYIGCTGFSTLGRFMVAAVGEAAGSGVGLNSTGNVEDCSFIGCHGKASTRGVVFYLRDGGASIKRVSFRDCSIDMTNDVHEGTPGAFYIGDEQDTGTAVLEDILIDNVAVISPYQRAMWLNNINRATITNCVFEPSRALMNQEVLLSECPDLVFTNNTVKSSGTIASFVLESATGGPMSDRGLIADNNFLGIKDGAFGVYIGGPALTTGTVSGAVVRGNRFQAAGSAPSGAIRVAALATGARIVGNDFSGWPVPLVASIVSGSLTTIYDNAGIPAVNTLTANTNITAHDDRRLILLNGATGVNRQINMQVDSKASLPVGEWFDAANVGLGNWLLAMEAGMTLIGAGTIEPGWSAHVVKTAADTYVSTVVRMTPIVAPTVVPNQYAEYPPATKGAGQIWMMPSNKHQAMWSGTAWVPMTPAAADANMCCILGNLDFYIDAESWTGTGTVTNLGRNGVNPTATGITQATDGSSRKYFYHDGVTSDFNLPAGTLDVTATDSVTLFAVKSQPSFVNGNPIWSNRTVVSSFQQGFSVQNNTATGSHSFRMGDTVVESFVLSTTVQAPNVVNLIIGQRNVATDTIGVAVGSEALVTAADTTTLSVTNPANQLRIGRYAAANTTRTTMNHYISGFVKRALTATEITTLQTWVAARYI